MNVYHLFPVASSKMKSTVGLKLTAEILTQKNNTTDSTALRNFGTYNHKIWSILSENIKLKEIIICWGANILFSNEVKA